MFYKGNNTSEGQGNYAGKTNRFAPSTHQDRPRRDTKEKHEYGGRERHEYETRRPKEREMIFGIRAVMEAIDAGKTLDKVLIRRDMSSAIGKELMDKLNALAGTDGAAVCVQKVPVEKLNQFTDKNHQGVIAFLSPIEFYNIEQLVPALYEAGKIPLLMVLDGITDVRNFGAIARTCVCTGVDALIMSSRGSAAVNGDAVKTSAGALHSLPICKVENLQNCLRFLRNSGLNVVAATEHATTCYTEANMREPLAIVMGNEEKGIYEENLKLCNEQVSIPMTGSIESLNVSVAAGVMLYEAVRQRK